MQNRLPPDDELVGSSAFSSTGEVGLRNETLCESISGDRESHLQRNLSPDCFACTRKSSLKQL